MKKGARAQQLGGDRPGGAARGCGRRHRAEQVSLGHPPIEF